MIPVKGSSCVGRAGYCRGGAGRDPVVHDAAADAEALGDGRLRQAVIEEMLK
jgi:hypothetical protein